MRILLDSHMLLWALVWDYKLPQEVLSEINNPENEIFYSTMSAWEISIKNMKNPTEMPVSGVQIIEYCEKFGYEQLPLLGEHVKQLPSLSLDESINHKDPFDRMLICQAKAENMVFITHDSMLSHYNEPCVKVI